MSEPASIHLENVTLAFDDTNLFEDFSMTIEAGKCTCLLGQSGSGKSTLLGLVSGNQQLQYDGNIYLSQQDDLPHKISWMAQYDLLLPWLKVRDNVLLGAKLRNEVTPALVRKAEDLLHEAGLGEYGDAYPSQLSGGMRQRVALLRTLMEDRPVILMDEPFSALDALTRMRLQNLSARMLHDKTVLMVTHDPLEALRLADRIVVLGKKPAEVILQIDMQGLTPRDTQEAEVQRNYKMLIEQLMDREIA